MTVNIDSFKFGKTKIYNKSLIKTLHEYIEYVDFLLSIWKKPLIWFRGVSKAKYTLIPSIYRSDNYDYVIEEEREMMDEFIRRAKGINPLYQNESDRWTWYQIMQHHGFPTRMLDWTSSSLIGLYFALRNIKSILTPSVWVLDPRWLNKKSANVDYVFYTDHSIRTNEDEYIDKYLDKY